MQFDRIIDFAASLMAKAWRSYVDDTKFDPETMLTEMAANESRQSGDRDRLSAGGRRSKKADT